MTHWAHLNIFPEPFIQLNRELVHHPQLQQLLSNHPAHEWEIRLAEIAVYCEVVLDGDYTPEQIEKLCEILRIKLIARREDNRGLLVIENGTVNDTSDLQSLVEDTPKILLS